MYYILVLILLCILNFVLVITETSLFAASRTKFNNTPKLLYLKTISSKVAVLIVLLDVLIQQGVSYILLSKLTGSVFITTTYSILTIYLYLFGKSIALINPEYFYGIFGYLLYIVYYLASPIITVIHYTVKLLISFFKFHPQNNTLASYVDEIKSILRSANNFERSDSELQIVDNMFDLRDTMISSIMLPRNQFCKIQYTNNWDLFLKSLLNNSQYRCIVIEQDDEIIGYIDFYTLLKDITNRTRKPSVDDYISEPVFIMESLSVFRVIQDSKISGNKLYFVINEYGIVLGLITLTDLFEELVCAQYDEDLHIKKVKDGFLIDGLQNIRLLNKYLHWELPEKFLTVSGLLINKFKKIPQEQEFVVINGIKFTIIVRGDNKVIRVLASEIENKSIE